MQIGNLAFVYVGIVVPLSILFPMICVIRKYKNMSPALRVLGAYLLVSGVTNLITSILAFSNIRNMPVMHAYTLAEFCIIGLFYKKAFGPGKISIAINWLMILFIVFCVANVMLVQGLFVFNTYTRSAEAAIFIVLGLFYFISTLDTISGDTINPLTYVNSGMLLYFSGSLAFFLVQNLHFPSETFKRLLWVLHATFVLVMYQLFAIAFLKYRR